MNTTTNYANSNNHYSHDDRTHIETEHPKKKAYHIGSALKPRVKDRNQLMLLLERVSASHSLRLTQDDLVKVRDSVHHRQDIQYGTRYDFETLLMEMIGDIHRRVDENENHSREICYRLDKIIALLEKK